MKQFIGEDESWNGIKTRYYWDSADNKIHEYRVSNVQNNIDANKAAVNAESDLASSRYKDSMYKAASVPLGLAEEWIKKHGFNAMTATGAEIMSFIESHPEYSYLKTTKGNVSRKKSAQTFLLDSRGNKLK